MEYETRRENFLISTDKKKLDIDCIYDFLSESYWAKGRPREVVTRSLENSLCFGVYDAEKDIQVGFARVVSDNATFAYIADLFIIEGYRKNGLSKFLMQTIMEHPELQILGKWMLGTKDAHSLYEKFGFGPLPRPERLMMKKNFNN